MVTATAPAIGAPSHVSVGKPHRFCPRCDASLIISYDDPECLRCGYVDYTYSPPKATVKDNLMSQATRFVFRYIGESPNLSETLTHARLERVRNKVVYGVTCPFCESVMEQSSLSGKRRELREERYRCEMGHRVSLIPRRDGGMGWK